MSNHNLQATSEGSDQILDGWLWKVYQEAGCFKDHHDQTVWKISIQKACSQMLSRCRNAPVHMQRCGLVKNRREGQSEGCQPSAPKQLLKAEHRKTHHCTMERKLLEFDSITRKWLAMLVGHRKHCQETSCLSKDKAWTLLVSHCQPWLTYWQWSRGPLMWMRSQCTSHQQGFQDCISARSIRKVASLRAMIAPQPT